jgi:hypothetical protein
MKFTKNQQGFSAIEAILILVIIGILGFAGWFVYNAQQSTDKTLSDANKSNAATPASKTSNVATFAECKAATGSVIQTTYPEICVTKGGQRFTDPSQSLDQKYLVIKEWNIKIPLSTAIDDGYYVFKDNYAYLSLKSLASTGCAADATTTGAINRVAVSSEEGSRVASVSGKVGNYYYYVQPPQAMCSEDSSTQAKADQARQAYMQAIKSVVAE